MNTEGIGTPIYRMNEIHNGMCDTNVTKYAVMPGDELAKFLLNDRDVLFNRTNSDEFVGRTGIYYNTDNVQKTFASYLVRFVPDEDMVTNEYFACFLNTKYAKAEIKRRSRPSVNQTNVNPEEVKAIKIPLLSRQLQSKIKLFFTEANRYRMIAEKLYNQAESILNTELQAPDFENSKNYSVKTMSNSFCLSGRLDAEYYQPKYDDLYRLLGNLPTETLGNLADIRKSIEPGSEFYCDDGIPFIRVSDVNIFGLEEPAVKLSKKKLSEKICSNYDSLYPKKDTILFSY